MTHNQIEYWSLQESKRHNTASEVETARHNVTTEQFNISQLNESSRHNLATETETGRHNLATEQLEASKQAETVRHNLESESQGRTDLNIKADSLQESIRHNQSVEAETAKHNRAQESENSRHNKASESIQAASNIETQVHNRAAEMLESEKLQETQRHSMVTENTAALQQEADEKYKQLQTLSNMALNSSNEQKNLAQVEKLRKESALVDKNYQLAKNKDTRETWKLVIDSLNTAIKTASGLIPLLGGRK